MTSQEQLWLDDFLQRLAATQATQKDPQADALIRERLAGRADAPYLLVQRAILLERALEKAQQHIAELQQSVPQASGSFLGGSPEPGFGRAPSTPGMYAGAASSAAPSTPAAGWREKWFGNGQSAPAPAAGGPGFLGTAASAAAGVAGGMFLFNGLESLLGGHHANGFLGGGNTGESPALVENVTQNFYAHDGDNLSGAANADSPLAHDAGADWNGFTSTDDGAGFLDDDLNT